MADVPSAMPTPTPTGSPPRRLRAGPPLRMYRVRVTATRRVTPLMLRVTLASDELEGFVDDGPDQRVKLVVPRPDQTGLPVHPETTPRDVMQMDASTRPIMRSYTVRAHRPLARELDIDFALHDAPGPATAWAIGARPGDVAAVFGPVGTYACPPGVRATLLIGDATALPAIGAILEQRPAGGRIAAVVAVAGPEEHQDLRVGPDASVTWVHEPGPGPLRAALAALEHPAQRGYAWIAGEAALVQELRADLVATHGWPESAIRSTGYWRGGVADSDPNAPSARS